jgi:hypothetical protein
MKEIYQNRKCQFFYEKQKQKKSLSRDVIGKFWLNYNCFMQYGDFIFFGRNSIEFLPSDSRHSIATVGFHMVMSLVKSRFSHSFIFYYFLFFLARPFLSRHVCLVGLVFTFFFLLLSFFLVDVVRSFYVRVFTKPTDPVPLVSLRPAPQVCSPISLDQVSNSGLTHFLLLKVSDRAERERCQETPPKQQQQL